MACFPSPISLHLHLAIHNHFPDPNSFSSFLNPRAMAKELCFNHSSSATKKLLIRILDSGCLTTTVCFGSSQDVSALVFSGAGRYGHGGSWCDIGSKREKCCAADGPPKIVNDRETVLKEVEDHELADVAAVSGGNDYMVGNMISEALHRVGRREAVTTENGTAIREDMGFTKDVVF